MKMSFLANASTLLRKSVEVATYTWNNIELTAERDDFVLWLQD